MTGQWIASGSKDGTVQIWEVETGRCLRVREVDEAVKHVSWNPEPYLPILAVVGLNTSIMRWSQHDKHEGIRLKHVNSISKVEWHRKGDYFTTVVPGGCKVFGC
ncbi:hypothetical protein QJS04_geneDACA022299 [Acorus gramineus]|uniref:Uncharacterized protein n=1 Tax=Acorus gramineus TaxID=55184 RepID=A0AAV9BAG1_ACOGR|nr:hypothetical protein QJS04_geneDACA022299 [Acorus gramineus]